MTLRGAAEKIRAMDARLLALSVGNFTTATGAFLVVGLLNEISADLAVPVAIAGLLGSAFAGSSSVAAPIVAILGTRITRRALLVGALAINAGSVLGSAFASSFAMLFGMRMVTGGSVGSFVPASVSTAGLLMPPERRSKAVFMIGLGASLGQVLGVPAGVWLGGLFGWRMPFLILGAVGIVVCAWIWRMVPARLMAATFNLASWSEVRRNRAILATLGATALQGGGGFITMAFVAPLLRESIGATPGTISALLGLFGLCGVCASLAAMRAMDRVGPSRLAVIALAAIAVNFLIWPLAHGSPGLTAFAIGLWGGGFIVIASAQQSRLVMLDPKLAPVTVAFNSSCVFGGSAVGTGVGSAIVAAFGLAALTWASLAVVCCAIALLAYSIRISTPRARA